MDERKEHLDPETKLALLTMKNEIISAVGIAIKESMDTYTEHLKNIYDLKIANIEEKYKSLGSKLDTHIKSGRFNISTLIAAIALIGTLYAIFK